MNSNQYNFDIDLTKSKIVFLGGAGVSTSSGIPDFRSPDGIYHAKKRYGVSVETILSHDYFLKETEKFYDFYWDKMVYPDAKPNKAHLALAEYERSGGKITVVTQNIDGLHQDAGSKNVYELHGTTKSYHCMDCHKHYGLDEINHIGVPKCPTCGGLIKPDVVLYGEMLPEEALYASIDAISKADVLVVGGTSLNVYPAAGLIDYFNGKTSILINKEETQKDSFFDYVIHDDVGNMLEKIFS